MTLRIRFASVAYALFILHDSTLCSGGLFRLKRSEDLSNTVQGNIAPVVLVHGFTVNPFLQWDVPGVTKGLARDYQVICIDCRGHGYSGKPHDPKMYGREIVRRRGPLARSSQDQAAHIVGYSDGRISITLNMLARYPERMLTATTGGAGWTDKVDSKFLNEVADSLANGKGLGPLMDRLLRGGVRNRRRRKWPASAA